MLCIVNPDISALDEAEGLWADLFSTHPPIRNRMDILLKMARVSISELVAKADKRKAAETGQRPPEPKYYAMNPQQQWQGPFALAELGSQPWLVAATGSVLGASALLGVRRSPMILLWSATGHRILPTADVVLDANAMRFAHGVGALLCGVVYGTLLIRPQAGFFALLALVGLKTVGACGFCTASKLYACAAQGGCCASARRRDA